MKPALLDTDILSEILKGRDAAVRRSAEKYVSLHGRLALSVLSIVEIVTGLEKRNRKDELRRFEESLRSFEVFPLTSDSAALAGRIFARLELAGQPIGRVDPLIAAIAMENQRTLVTGNVRHYARIRDAGFDLTLENWREEQA